MAAMQLRNEDFDRDADLSVQVDKQLKTPGEYLPGVLSIYFPRS